MDLKVKRRRSTMQAKCDRLRTSRRSSRTRRKRCAGGKQAGDRLGEGREGVERDLLRRVGAVVVEERGVQGVRELGLVAGQGRGRGRGRHRAPTPLSHALDRGRRINRYGSEETWTNLKRWTLIGR
jgi:hypothetical protein